MKLEDILKSALIGRKLRHTNPYGREVVLEIENFQAKHNSRPIEEATPANDWWPREETWTTYEITFVDGSKITTSLTTDLKFE